MQSRKLIKIKQEYNNTNDQSAEETLINNLKNQQYKNDLYSKNLQKFRLSRSIIKKEDQRELNQIASKNFNIQKERIK